MAKAKLPAAPHDNSPYVPTKTRAHTKPVAQEGRRILLVTNEKFSLKGVRVVSWTESIPNAADYDVVLLDLVTLSDPALNVRIDSSKSVRPKPDEIVQLLWSDGMVICITPPVQAITYGRISVSPYWWSPIPLENVLEAGESRIINDARCKRYFERGVHEWKSRLDLTAESVELDSGNVIRFEIEPLVSTRYGQPLAGEASMQIWERSPFGGSLSPGKRSSSIFVLPQPDSISISEALKLIFQDQLEWEFETPAPDWTNGFPFPGEAETRKRISSMNSNLGVLRQKIGEAQTDLEDLLRMKRLLYADGPELEAAVWRALEILGAEVHESDIANREDRWFSLPDGRKAAMEIKGRTGSIATADARQTHDWVTDFLEKRGEQVKGILFGNPHRLVPLSERGRPWEDDVVRFAAKSGLALVTAPELYGALVKVLTGQTKPEVFFEALFLAEGPITFGS